MEINLDKLLSGMDGWDLALTIGGNAFTVEAPTNAAGEALQTILAADAVTKANRPDLEKLIAPLIHEPSADVKTWKLDELVGAATAVAIHTREIHNAKSRGICRAVVEAMRPGQFPAARVAAIPNVPGGGGAKGEPDAQPTLAAEARRAMMDYVHRLTGVTVPPETSDNDLGELAVNASKSAMRPENPHDAEAEQRA
jgi:hypothetical protein